MQASRADRMPERIKETVAELVATLKDPRIGFVTITDVRTTADLSHARVFYTVLGAPTDAPDGRDVTAAPRDRAAEAALDADPTAAERRTAEGLRSATPLLRRELGRRLRIRQTPSLEFVHDPLPAQGRRIEALIEQARKPR